jgi:cytochrome c oxidase subunit I
MSNPEKSIADQIRDEGKPEEGESHKTPGTLVLVLIFLACFAVYYFANWKALADVWHVR